VHLGMLWVASLLVPTPGRSEWSEEWRNEMWYVLRECSSQTSIQPRSIKEAAVFCMGAYRDAIWLRMRSWQKQQVLSRICGSPAFCLLFLSVAFFAAWGFARMSPRVAAGMSRVEVYPWPISEQNASPCDCVSDLIAEGRSAKFVQQYFDGFSHYKLTRQAVLGPTMTMTEWTIGHAKADLFAALRLPILSMQPGKAPTDRSPRILLSEQTWRQDFGAKTNIGGARLRVGSVNATIGGVALGASMGLPGNVNAWLLGADSQVGGGNAEFVAWHLTPAGYFQMGPRWVLSLFGIVLAFLVLPCLTYLSWEITVAVSTHYRSAAEA
jgi:hypothetical protein